jgi:predicted enzyme related to lactoylglutathione lyase
VPAMTPPAEPNLASAPLVAFVGVSDLSRAANFYGKTLGLPLRDEAPYALVAEIAGTMLRVTLTDQPAAASYTVLGWRVDDIDAAVDELVARGVRFTCYEGLGADEREIWQAPSGARIAWFTDPDGNVLSLTQHQ